MVSRPCRRRRPSALDDGGNLGVFLERRPQCAVSHGGSRLLPWAAVYYQGLPSITVGGLLIALASPVVEYGLWGAGLQRLQHVGSAVGAPGQPVQLLCGTWDLLGPGIEPVFPGFFTTEPSAKPQRPHLNK